MSAIELVCLSKKPAQSEPRKRSAARQLLRVCAEALSDAHIEAGFIDLRDVDFPWFDGRPVEAYGEAVQSISQRLTAARAVLFSFPAYWGGLNGYGKNFLDVMGGAAYDASDRGTPLSSTFVSAVVVGGSAGDSGTGLAQFRHSLAEMGAIALPWQVTLDNPRTHPNLEAVITECRTLPLRLARVAGIQPTASASPAPAESVATELVTADSLTTDREAVTHG